MQYPPKAVEYHVDEVPEGICKGQGKTIQPHKLQRAVNTREDHSSAQPAPSKSAAEATA